MTLDVLVPFLAAIVGGALRVGVPFLFVSLGECLTEKSGRINLGLEGVLVFSAMAGFGGAYLSGSPWIGVAVAACAGAVLALLHGVLCSLPRVNDVATGIALMLFGTGLAFYLGKPLIQPQAAQLPPLALGGWSDSPVVQAALQVNPLLPLGIVLAIAMHWGFGRTRWGLLVRLAGDSASATKALGYSVDGIRIAATVVGGAIAGLGGAFADALLSGQLERRHLERPGPDRGRARHLRALERAALRRRRAALRRRRRDRPGAAVDRRQPGLLPVRRRALRADAGHPRHQLPSRQRRARQPGRAVVGEIASEQEANGMSGLGGLNKSPNGVVIGLVQLQLPVVETPAQLAAQTERIVAMVGKARRNNAGLDLVVFPEYSLHGLSMSTAPELMCRMDGPEVAAFKAACVENRLWGCFSIMEFNPNGNPYNTGIVIDDHGRVAPVLPQAPSVGAGRGVGAGQLRHPGDRRPEGLQARARSSATTACSPRWRASAPTRAPK